MIKEFCEECGEEMEYCICEPREPNQAEQEELIAGEESWNLNGGDI